MSSNSSTRKEPVLGTSIARLSYPSTIYIISQRGRLACWSLSRTVISSSTKSLASPTSIARCRPFLIFVAISLTCSLGCQSPVTLRVFHRKFGMPSSTSCSMTSDLCCEHLGLQGPLSKNPTPSVLSHRVVHRIKLHSPC